MFFIFIVMMAIAGSMLLLSRAKSFSPAVLLCGSWAYIYLLQALFASDMHYSFMAAVIIILITLSFALGEVSGQHLFGYNNGGAVATPSINRPGGRERRRLGGLIFLFALLSIAGALEYMRVLGFFKTSNLMEAFLEAGRVRADIMSGSLNVPLISRFGFIATSIGVVLALVYYYCYEWRWWLATPMIAVIIMGASQAGRAGTVILLIQLFYVIALKYRFKNQGNLARLAMWGGLLLGLLFVIVFVGGFILRGGGGEITVDRLMYIASFVRSYLFGGVSAFAVYVDDIMQLDSLDFGKYSFSSLFAALGISSQAIGVYDQFVTISPYGETTNLYTAFRSFVDDFMLPGAMLFYLAAGLVVSRVLERFERGRLSYLAILIPIASWLMFSPMYSLTYFNSFLASCVVPFLLLRYVVRMA